MPSMFEPIKINGLELGDRFMRSATFENSASAVWDEHTGITPCAPTADEAEQLVGAYADDARRAVEAGFDAIQLHVAHGYLMNQSISLHTNRRPDAWGGSTEGRMRFVAKVLPRFGKDPTVSRIRQERCARNGLEDSLNLG